MANGKEIRRRIRSVQNTGKITKAMKLVSASKLRRAQGSVVSARPYKNKLKEVLSRLVASAGSAISDPLLEVREVKKVGFVVFTSNKGLAGGYNANIMKEALAEVNAAQAKGYEVGIVAVGRKARDFFQKRGYTIDEEFLAVNDIPSAIDADAITKLIKTAYVTGQYDEVYIVYAEFRSAMSQIPKTAKVLPVETPESEAVDGLDYIFEPSPEVVLSQILPLYLANQVFSALTEAKAGEHGARMTAMSAATDNASALVDRLNLDYNRARQAAITNEITEIVAGVSALS